MSRPELRNISSRLPPLEWKPPLPWEILASWPQGVLEKAFSDQRQWIKDQYEHQKSGARHYREFKEAVLTTQAVLGGIVGAFTGAPLLFSALLTTQDVIRAAVDIAKIKIQPGKTDVQIIHLVSMAQEIVKREGRKKSMPIDLSALIQPALTQLIQSGAQLGTAYAASQLLPRQIPVAGPSTPPAGPPGGLVPYRQPPPLLRAPLGPVEQLHGPPMPGYHWSAKRGWVRNRRMNPLNPKALRRAQHRLTGFEHFVRRSFTIVGGGKLHRKGKFQWKKRKHHK